MKATKEKEEHVITAIVEYLAYQGIVLHRIVERIPTRDVWGRIRGRTSTPGMPDLVGYVPRQTIAKWATKLPGGALAIPLVPHPVYIEVKRPGGRRRPRQEMFIAAMRNDGVCAFFADSVDAAVQGLRAHGFPVRAMGELG